MYRQGDLLFVPVAPLPAGCPLEDSPYHNKVIIARGEKSGHMHVVAAEIHHGGGSRYLVAAEPVTVTHEEHQPLPLPAGTYRIVQQRELTPEAVQVVSD